MLETLLQYGGSASTPDRHGYTAIHKASYNGHDKCLEVLLEVGVVSGCGLMCAYLCCCCRGMVTTLLEVHSPRCTVLCESGISVIFIVHCG